MVADDLEDDDRKASGGSADLQGGASEASDHDAADNPSEDSLGWRRSGCERDAHAQGQRD